jgi:hypothetical protein
MDLKIADKKTVDAVKQLLKCTNEKYDQMLRSDLTKEEEEYIQTEENKLLNHLGYKQQDSKQQEYVLFIEFHKSSLKKTFYSTDTNYLFELLDNYNDYSYSWSIKKSNAVELD